MTGFIIGIMFFTLLVFWGVGSFITRNSSISEI